MAAKRKAVAPATICPGCTGTLTDHKLGCKYLQAILPEHVATGGDVEAMAAILSRAVHLYDTLEPVGKQELDLVQIIETCNLYLPPGRRIARTVRSVKLDSKLRK